VEQTHATVFCLLSLAVFDDDLLNAAIANPSRVLWMSHNNPKIRLNASQNRQTANASSVACQPHACLFLSREAAILGVKIDHVFALQNDQMGTVLGKLLVRWLPLRVVGEDKGVDVNAATLDVFPREPMITC
jgi:hypothetical protein